MKWYLTLLTALLVKISLFAAIPKLDCSAQSAILISGQTGKVLFAKNETKLEFPASLTKIATAIYALEKGKRRLGEKFYASQTALGCISSSEKRKNNYNKYPPYILEHDMSHIGLKVGEEMTLGDLLYGLLIPSGDDAANVIAENISGSIPKFMDELNQFLKKIGCRNTHFVNPSGLHHPDHVTTAQDMATLCYYAAKNELFMEMVRTASYERPTTNKQEKSLWTTTNKLLRRGSFYYPYACGMKTGWHSKAEHCLAACATKDNRLLIAIFFHCPERKQLFSETKRTFEKAFSEKRVDRVLLDAGAQNFEKSLSGADRLVMTYLTEKLTVSYYPSEEPQVRALLQWDIPKLPIEKGAKVGTVQLLVDEVPMKQLPLLSQHRVEWSLWAYCKEKILFSLLIGGGILAAAFFVFWKRKPPL